VRLRIAVTFLLLIFVSPGSDAQESAPVLPRLVPQTQPVHTDHLAVDYHGRYVAGWSAVGFEIWSVRERALLSRMSVGDLIDQGQGEGAVDLISHVEFGFGGAIVGITTQRQWIGFDPVTSRVLTSLDVREEMRLRYETRHPYPDTAEREITAIGLSPVGYRVATGRVHAGTPVLSIMDSESDDPPLFVLPAPATRVRWNASGTHVIVRDLHSGTHVFAWDAREVDGQYQGATLDADAAEWSGSWLSSRTDGPSQFLTRDGDTVLQWRHRGDGANGIRALRASTGEILWQIPLSDVFDEHEQDASSLSLYVECLGLVGEPERLVLVANTPSFKLIDARSGAVETRNLETEQGEWLGAACASGDGRLIACSLYGQGIDLVDEHGRMLWRLGGRAGWPRIVGIDRSQGLVYLEVTSESRLGSLELALPRLEVRPVTPILQPTDDVVMCVATDSARPLATWPGSTSNYVSFDDSAANGRLIRGGSSRGFGDRHRVIETSDSMVVCDIVSGESVASWPRVSDDSIVLATVLESREQVMTVDDLGRIRYRRLEDGADLGEFDAFDPATFGNLLGVHEISGGQLLMHFERGFAHAGGTGPAGAAEVYVYQLDVSPDGERVAIRTSGEVRIYEVGQESATEHATLATEGRPYFYGNDHLLVETYHGIEVWSLTDLRRLVTVLCSSEGDSAFVLDDGRYTCSREGLDLIAFADGGGVLPAAQLDASSNQPHEVARSIGLAGETLISSLQSAYQERRARLGVSAPAASLGRPEFTIVSPAPRRLDSNLARVPIRVTEDSAAISSVRIVVNGMPTSLEGQRVTTDASEGLVPVPLFPGLNRIELALIDERGVASLPRVLHIRSDIEPETQKTFFLGIGVSDYIGAAHDLRFAAKDVRDVERAFRTIATGPFESLMLLDDAATIDSVREARSFLKTATSADRVIIYLAGHGFATARGYAFGVADVDFDNPGETGLLFDDIEQLLDGLFVASKLVFIDSCHAGEFALADTHEEIGTEAGRSVRARGFAMFERQSDALGSSPRVEEIFANVENSIGATTLASSGGLEISIEDEGVENGLFSSCVIDAVLSGLGDIDDDGVLRSAELLTTVADRVETLSQGIQRPVLRTAPVGFDAPIVWSRPSRRLYGGDSDREQFMHPTLSPDGQMLFFVEETTRRGVVIESSTGDLLYECGLESAVDSPWSLTWVRWVGHCLSVRLDDRVVDLESAAIHTAKPSDADGSTVFVYDDSGRWCLSWVSDSGLVLSDESGSVAPQYLGSWGTNAAYDSTHGRYCVLSGSELYAIVPSDEAKRELIAPVAVRDEDAQYAFGNLSGHGRFVVFETRPPDAVVYVISDTESGRQRARMSVDPLEQLFVATPDGPSDTTPLYASKDWSRIVDVDGRSLLRTGLSGRIQHVAGPVYMIAESPERMWLWRETPARWRFHDTERGVDLGWVRAPTIRATPVRGLNRDGELLWVDKASVFAQQVPRSVLECISASQSLPSGENEGPLDHGSD
jgi:hypothetical protein